MSDDTATIRAELWAKMRNKPYRDKFVAAHLSTNIVAQIQSLREARGWSQKHLAEKSGMSPSRISVMEDPSYDKFTMSTLKRLASAFDVALVTRFAPFSDLVNWVASISPEKLEVASFETDTLDARKFEEPNTARIAALGGENPISLERREASLGRSTGNLVGGRSTSQQSNADEEQMRGAARAYMPFPPKNYTLGALV